MGVSRKTLYQWKKKGMPVEPDGKFNLVKISAWRAGWDTETIPIDEISGADECDSRVYWDKEWRRLRAQILELDLKAKLGELIALEDVVAAWAKRSTNLVAGLRQLKDRLPPVLVGKSVHEIAAIVEEECDLIRTALLKPDVHTPALTIVQHCEICGAELRQRSKKND
jgi:hypothetical protein